MIKEIKNYKRLDLFNHYHQGNNPFVIVTTQVEVTNVVKFCQQHKNFYATLGFIITKTVNQIENFKYRYKNGKIYYCDELKSSYTQMLNENTIGFFGLPNIIDYNAYIKKFLEVQERFLQTGESITENDLDEIWLSCAPWFSFTSLIPPFNKEVTIPQFIWDKYRVENDKYYINLMIMVHHGFADGYHIGKFLSLLDENIKSWH